MEDYEAQEQEFWRKLGEEEISRASMLKRSAAAAAGLTVLAAPSAAWARREAAAKTPPLRGRDISLKEMIAEAKKEGHVNFIALPRDWANYGEMMDTFKKKYGISYTDDNPDGSSAQENQAIVSLKGDKRAPDAVDVSWAFAATGANTGLYAHYYVSTWKTIPRSFKDGRGYWVGDYAGVISIGTNRNIVKNPPKSFKDLLKPEYKNQVALNGSPLTSGSAFGGVFAASIANGGSLNDIGPGIDFFAKLKQSGNFIPVQSTPQTVASGQTPISIDWDYLNLAYTKEFPSANWITNLPSDGVYAGPYAQAVNATAPHPWAARLWQEFMYSDQGQIIWLKGFVHPARFDDLARRKVIPASISKALPSPAIYAKVKFASLAQIAKAKAKVNADWASKVG
jgi:putative spermidine/putrescine transport system substrate-binding protein